MGVADGVKSPCFCRGFRWLAFLTVQQIALQVVGAALEFEHVGHMHKAGIFALAPAFAGALGG